MQAEKVIEWIADQRRSGGYSHHDSVRFHWEPSGTWATVKREGIPPWVSKELSSLSGKGAFDIDGRAYAVFRSFAGWQIDRWSGGTRKKHLSYKRVIKPEDKGTKTFSPSPDLQKYINDYVKLVQQKVDKGTSADDAFKERPDYDNLTGDDLLELFLNNPSLGMNPMKELNYLDLFGLLQQVVEQTVWTEAVKWWGKQKTEVNKKKEKTDRDTTETVVERPMAAKWKRAAKKPISWKQLVDKLLGYLAKRDLKGFVSFWARNSDEDTNYASEIEGLWDDIEQLEDNPKIYGRVPFDKDDFEELEAYEEEVAEGYEHAYIPNHWDLKTKTKLAVLPDVGDFLEKAEQLLYKRKYTQQDRLLKKDPDLPFLKILEWAFTVTVYPKDIKYVNYKPYKNYVRMNDSEGQLGHMRANINNTQVVELLKEYGIKNPTVKMFIDFLKRRGAHLLKKRKPRKHYPPLYD